MTTRHTVDDRTVTLLVLVPQDGSETWHLYDPKLVVILGHELRFQGLEREGTAWVMQEWDCTLQR